MILTPGLTGWCRLRPGRIAVPGKAALGRFAGRGPQQVRIDVPWRDGFYLDFSSRIGQLIKKIRLEQIPIDFCLCTGTLV